MATEVAHWHEPAWKVHKDAYQARCACGWRGPVKRTWIDARTDLSDHLGAVPYQFAACAETVDTFGGNA